jgi:hypothetical protein
MESPEFTYDTVNINVIPNIIKERKKEHKITKYNSIKNSS